VAALARIVSAIDLAFEADVAQKVIRKLVDMLHVSAVLPMSTDPFDPPSYRREEMGPPGGGSAQYLVHRVSFRHV